MGTYPGPSRKLFKARHRRTLSMPARPSSDVHTLLQLADLDEEPLVQGFFLRFLESHALQQIRSDTSASNSCVAMASLDQV